MNQESAEISGAVGHVSAVLLSPTPRGARLARLLSREWLRTWPVAPALADTAEHLVAELATNAATHARVPGRSFLLTVSVGAGVLRVEVTDTHGDTADRVGPQLPAETAESGRGLLIVQSLADRWGVEEGPCPRKVVWAELDVAGERGWR